jgi:hypothetical protein
VTGKGQRTWNGGVMEEVGRRRGTGELWNWESWDNSSGLVWGRGHERREGQTSN